MVLLVWDRLRMLVSAPATFVWDSARICPCGLGLDMSARALRGLAGPHVAAA